MRLRLILKTYIFPNRGYKLMDVFLMRLESMSKKREQKTNTKVVIPIGLVLYK